MSEYWKSTPTYWCKFCKTYVRDTTLEKKNHDATPKHQNNLQRSIREIHKAKERESRETSRAKEEVARLNGVVDGTKPATSGKHEVVQKTVAPPFALQEPSSRSSASAQRKAHAEQLAAMGVELPEELKREVTGVGGWHVVSERIVDEQQSMAEIKAEATAEDWKESVDAGALSRGVRKRQTDGEGEEDEVASKRKPWGSKFKSYPGQAADEGEEDLDALLSGLRQRKVKIEEELEIKEEPQNEEEGKPLDIIPDAEGNVKEESEEAERGETTPPVVFKKRKIKR